MLWDESWTRDGVDRTPIIPSHEVSGTVLAVGRAVTDVSIGQDVYGLIDFDRDGAAAEYVTVRAADLAAKPTSVDHVQSAALPLAALTAWQALFDHAHLTAGESVLVLGGAGGVGAYVVQLAHHFGARVTATVNASDTADYVTALGADEVSSEPPGHVRRRHRHRRRAGLAAAYAHVRDGGRLITLSAPPVPSSAGRDVHDEFFVVRPDRAQLEQLAALVDAGRADAAGRRDVRAGRRGAAYADRGRHGGPGKTVLIVR